MTDNIQNATALETETCTRCGGSGEYSYCSMYGRTCFRCRGAKRTYTKRGEMALSFLRNLRSKRADQFKPGELIWSEDGIFAKSRFCLVATVEMKGANVAIDYVGGGGIETSPETMIRRGCTAEEKTATMKQALVYQATLTKRGTVRKDAAQTALFA